jgi:hypothetical protein
VVYIYAEVAKVTGPIVANAASRASSFIANIAEGGGAMFVRDDSTAVVELTDFSANQARVGGGGVAITNRGQVRS